MGVIGNRKLICVTEHELRVRYEYNLVETANKIIFNTWNYFVIKAFGRMNGNSTLSPCIVSVCPRWVQQLFMLGSYILGTFSLYPGKGEPKNNAYETQFQKSEEGT